jgi:signal transduction histidine kinase
MTEPQLSGPRDGLGGRAGWLRRVRRGLRWRILVWYVGFLALATLASVVIARQLVLSRLDQRIDNELTQEATELRRLALGNDPETGEPFGSRVRRIFSVYLDRNVPSRNEALLTFVEGEPFLRSGQVVPYRLDRDAELVARWGGLERTDRGRVDTPAGEVDYLAVPLVLAGAPRGVFVVATFRDLEKAELGAAIRAEVGVGIAMLLIGSVLAWRLAERVLRQVDAVARTARSITESDLSGRIPVEGKDELARLAATFNEMLDRLQAAFARQREFVDDAGHELRTPITIIRGHLELLDDDPVERRETLALVMDELDRMNRIVNDLLVLAKAGTPDLLDLGTVDLGGFTEELYEKAKALAPREWVLERSGRGVLVADRQRLTQAVIQLAQNAVTHAPGDQPIVVGSELVDGHARLWVRDCGPGVPLHEQARIFERFERGSGGSRREGAGLGLSIVTAIAEAHHGRVELASVPGEGAQFTIVIPIDQPVAELQEAQ